MKHRKGQNVTDIVAALAVAGLVSVGFSVMLEGRALADQPEQRVWTEHNGGHQ